MPLLPRRQFQNSRPRKYSRSPGEGAAQDRASFDPFYVTMGEDPDNILTHIGVLADHAEEQGSPLAAFYRAIFENGGQYNPPRRTSEYSHYMGGHHTLWTIGNHRGTTVFHEFHPQADGTVRISLGGTSFRPVGTHKSIESQYAYVSPELAESAIAHLHSMPDTSSHWGRQDDQPGRARVDDPITHFRNRREEVMGQVRRHMSRREVALRYAKPVPDDKLFTTPAKSVTTGVQSPTWMRPRKDSTGQTTWQGVKGSPEIHPAIRGTRLAVVLREIAGRFGDKEPEFKRLAAEALKGTGNIGGEGDVYYQIRQLLTHHASGRSGAMDRLGGEGGVVGKVGTRQGPEPFTPGEAKRMEQLAKSYNWHRVGKGVQIDEAVNDYVTKIASDRLKSQNAHLRAAHNLFGLGWESRGKPVSAEHRKAFLAGLLAHVKKVGVGPQSTYGMAGTDVNEKTVLRSLRRLGQAEEQQEALSRARPESKVSPIDPEHPAWTGRPEKPRVSPRARAGQYSRLEASRMYARWPWSRGGVEKDPTGGEITKNAIVRVLQNLGVDSSHLPQYQAAIRRHLTHPNTKDDPLSQMYRQGLASADSPTGIFDVANKVRGMVGYYANQFGHRTPSFNLYEPSDLLSPAQGGNEDAPFDLADESLHDNPEQHFAVGQTPYVPDPAVRRPRNPGLPRDKRAAIYKDIADFRKQSAGGKPVTRQATVAMIAEKHGMDTAEADKHLENFNKLKARPESGAEPASPPGKPRGGKVSKRKFTRKPTLKHTVKGQTYSFKKNDLGWAVVSMDNAISRVSRAYQVYCDESGNPTKCSCPDNFYRGGVCKHMKAVSEINADGGEGDEPGAGEEEVQLSRRHFARKYGRQNEMMAFHKAFHESVNPIYSGPAVDRNTNNHLVYADWLQDQGMDATAEAIRKSANAVEGPDMWDTRGDTDHWISPHRPGEFVAIRETPAYPKISLLQRSLVNPRKYFWWVAHYPDKATRDNALKKMIREGVTYAAEENTDNTPMHEEIDDDPGDGTTPTGDPEEDRQSRVDARRRRENPEKLSAYRAPAGGMVARGTFYKGGAMVPDMKGEFMAGGNRGPTLNPKSFDPKKLAAVRSRMKVRKMPPAVAMQDGTSAPVSGMKKYKIPT